MGSFDLCTWQSPWWAPVHRQYKLQMTVAAPGASAGQRSHEAPCRPAHILLVCMSGHLVGILHFLGKIEARRDPASPQATGSSYLYGSSLDLHKCIQDYDQASIY